MFHTGTHKHKRLPQLLHPWTCGPILRAPVLTWTRHQSVCRGCKQRASHYLNPTHLYFIVGRHKRACAGIWKGEFPHELFSTSTARGTVCATWCRGWLTRSAAGPWRKRYGTSKWVCGDDTAQKVKSGKICALEGWLMAWEIWIWKFRFWWQYAAMALSREQANTNEMPDSANKPGIAIHPPHCHWYLFISCFKIFLGLYFNHIFQDHMGSSSISISELFPRQLLMILNLIISKYSVGVTIIPYLHKIFIVSFMDFWTGNCKANITSVTSENILSAILRAQWPITN